MVNAEVKITRKSFMNAEQKHTTRIINFLNKEMKLLTKE